MNDESALTIFPNKQIKAYDGMAITADVWAEAHDEHRKALQAHDLVFHGAGVIAGLEVLANDPPDQYVFISPGVGVDSGGNIIVVAEQVAYDFGNAVEGTLYLLLGHGEREVGGVQDEVRYLQDEYVVAARPALPTKRPAVELARINLSKRGAPVKNAAAAGHPGIDELDLRYRQDVSPAAARLVKVGLCSLGKDSPAALVTGWDYLARECQKASSSKLIVDAGIPLPSDLQAFSIVYLSASGAFKADANTVKELGAFLGQQGKGLIIEALDSAAEESFKPLLSELGVTLKSAGENDLVMKTPNVFCAPPDGAQGNSISFGKNVAYSTAGYALAWSGKVKSGSRADIRSALEWGVNLVEYCLKAK
jgi:hypothetical protein